MKKHLKKNIKILLGLNLGFLVTSGVVYANSAIAASSVTYSAPSGKGSATTVEGAINELYQQTQNAGESSTEKDYFLYGVTGHNDSNLQTAAGVCANFNGNVFCMNSGGYDDQLRRLQTFCTSISGTWTKTTYNSDCTLGSVYCRVQTGGYLYCDSGGSGCGVFSYGGARCS